MESIANVSVAAITNVSMATIANVPMESMMTIGNVSMESMTTIANVSMESITNVSMATIANVPMESMTTIANVSMESITNMSSCASAWSHREKLAKVSLVVFLFVGFCMGLPTLVWALLYLRAYRDRGATISPFMIALLLSDVVELALIPLMVYFLFQDDTCGWTGYQCVAMYPLFASLRLCGFVYHQLVALQGVWALRRAISSATKPSLSFRRFAYNYVSFSVFVWTCFILVSVSEGRRLPRLVICGVICFLVAFTSRDAFTSFPSTDAVYRRLASCRDPRLNIFVAYMAILCFVYGPFVVVMVFDEYIDPCVDSLLFFASLSVMSLRLMAEPLLCVLVCREFGQTCQTLDLRSD
ncbi:uncharacterized protein LOC134060105 [Sardina pilchardus]|uniref:uncharacterized protein LOC134060105 n=1 Tax=Sardina pilchardus TaxID=27697 RepID=UPI002E1035D1